MNGLVAEALLLVSRGEIFTDFILTDLRECFEMLNNFGFQIDGDLPRAIFTHQKTPLKSATLF